MKKERLMELAGLPAVNESKMSELDDFGNDIADKLLEIGAPDEVVDQLFALVKQKMQERKNEN